MDLELQIERIKRLFESKAQEADSDPISHPLG
jgi:hypothetical protein